MGKLRDHWEQWKLRLLDDGHLVDEIMCSGPALAIGARSTMNVQVLVIDNRENGLNEYGNMDG